MIDRRNLLSLVAAGLVLPAVARAADPDPLFADRAIGSPDAKNTIIEYFSLTCPHCAAFSRDVFPKVKTQLIDTGKVRYVFRDYPLDQLALTAAMVARALPPDRYEPFISALFASQDRWAYARGVNNTEELWKTAALAGMSRQTFDAAIANEALKKAIVAGAEKAQNVDHVDSTPTFIINGERHAGGMDFDSLAKMLHATG
jgi:protein-disulfide isomerase